MSEYKDGIERLLAEREKSRIAFWNQLIGFILGALVCQLFK